MGFDWSLASWIHGGIFERRMKKIEEDSKSLKQFNSCFKKILVTKQSKTKSK
jgi:hypothetical protein